MLETVGVSTGDRPVETPALLFHMESPESLPVAVSDGVTVTLDARDGDLLLTVSSPGPRFDLDAAIERAKDRDPLADLDGGGLGLPLLLGLFDAVSNDYSEDQGNRITLRKQRWREEGAVST